MLTSYTVRRPNEETPEVSPSSDSMILERKRHWSVTPSPTSPSIPLRLLLQPLSGSQCLLGRPCVPLCIFRSLPLCLPACICSSLVASTQLRVLCRDTLRRLEEDVLTVLKHRIITKNQPVERIKLVTSAVQRHWWREARRGLACCPQGAPLIMAETRAIQKAKRKFRVVSSLETGPGAGR